MIGIGVGIWPRRTGSPYAFESRPTSAGYALDSKLSFARASSANDFNASGVLTSFGTNTLRTGYSPSTSAALGALIEGTVTNQIRNPRAEGSTAGDLAGAGVLPTNWVAPSAVSGVTFTVVGTGTESGLPYLDLQISGTPASTTSVNLWFESTTQVTAATADLWTASVFATIQAGALTNFTQVALLCAERDSSGAALVSTATNISPADTFLAKNRAVAIRTFNNAGTARAVGGLALGFTSGAAVSLTLRLGAPQLEKLGYPTSVILPAAGSPAATQRSSDFLTLSGAGFSGLFPSATQGAAIIDCYMDSTASQAAGRTMIQVDDGSNANRVQLRTNAGGSLYVIVPVVGNSTGSAVNISSALYGSTVRLGLRWNGTSFGVSINGGAVATAATGPNVAFSTLRFGDISGGTNNLNGRISLIRTLATAPSDTDFRAYCTAGA